MSPGMMGRAGLKKEAEMRGAEELFGGCARMLLLQLAESPAEMRFQVHVHYNLHRGRQRIGMGNTDEMLPAVFPPCLYRQTRTVAGSGQSKSAGECSSRRSSCRQCAAVTPELATNPEDSPRLVKSTKTAGGCPPLGGDEKQ